MKVTLILLLEIMLYRKTYILIEVPSTSFQIPVIQEVVPSKAFKLSDQLMNKKQGDLTVFSRKKKN